MDPIMLTGALIVALGGVMALAFRVVRLPLSKRGKASHAGARPAITRDGAAKVGPREPAQALLIHVTDEYKRHTMALREALDLRRARNEAEALNRLLTERILHVEAARTLSQFIQPTLGGRVRQVIDQTRLDWLAESVRREVAEARFPTTQSRPLSGERALTRFITWARGGPQVGAPHELATYHRDQREHYRLAMTQARRFVREQRQADARSRLTSEQAYHLRASRELKRQLQSTPDAGSELFGATDPALTAILN
ncbi:MAG TPA: hypothetical protein VIC27_10710 [Ktedonobacterales bacterium]|jgi:hypothetical protein